MKLMVYGSLKKGYWNHHCLSGATLLGEAITKKKYVLYDCGFPMAVPFSLKGHPLLPIMGEVYEVGEDVLSRCDRLEGHPNWYKRDLVPVFINGLEEEVLMYEMNEDVNHTLSNISNGIYNWLG